MSKASNWLTKYSESMSDLPVLVVDGVTICKLDPETGGVYFTRHAFSQSEMKAIVNWHKNWFEENTKEGDQ